MGCASSTSKSGGAVGKVGMVRRRGKRKSTIPMVAVFVPSLRAPVPVDLVRPLRGLVPRGLLDHLCELRGRIVMLSEQNALSVVPELQQALKEYLPVLLGLTKKENRLDGLVGFKWKNLEGDGQGACFASAWYEVLSVVHLMAMLSILEANMLLVPVGSPDKRAENVSEESKKNVIELLLRASGYLDYCVHRIMFYLPLQTRQDLPTEMQEGALETISIQALGQCVEMQLGLAAECKKATLSVKRRLACEEVTYFSQAHHCFSGCATDDYYGKKHLLFIKWKYLEAKAAAYYYHGLLLDKNNGPKDHINAVNCLLAADELLMDSKRSCISFCLAVPVTRVPPVWGVMKHLNKKVPEVSSKKCQMYGYLFEQEMELRSLPELPVFSLSLKPEEYELPEIDASWDDEILQPVLQSLKEHLKDDD